MYSASLSQVVTKPAVSNVGVSDVCERTWSPGDADPRQRLRNLKATVCRAAYDSLSACCQKIKKYAARVLQHMLCGCCASMLQAVAKAAVSNVNVSDDVWLARLDHLNPPSSTGRSQGAAPGE